MKKELNIKLIYWFPFLWSASLIAVSAFIGKGVWWSSVDSGQFFCEPKRLEVFLLTMLVSCVVVHVYLVSFKKLWTPVFASMSIMLLNLLAQVYFTLLVIFINSGS